MKDNKNGFKSLIKNIESNKFMIPSWQREYVWDLNRITILFDSIFKGYPISNILLWETQNDGNGIFYKFLQNCEFTGKNAKSENDNADDRVTKVIGILDGQQRLTSVYLVLGANTQIFCVKKGNKNEYKLKVNFLDEENFVFEFNNVGNGWFDLKNLFNKKDYFDNELEKMELDNSSKKIVKKRYKQFKKKLEAFKFSYTPVRVNRKTALEIFDRINTQGKGLTMPEMTYSLLVHEDNELRKYLNDNIKKINRINKFNFRIDFFIKLIMLLQFNNPKYKYKDIEENLDSINLKWKQVFESTKKVCKLLKKYDMSDSTISSYNAIVPVVFYYYNKKNKIGKSEEKSILFYLRISMIKGLYGGSSDSTINKMCEAIKNLLSQKKPISIHWIKKLSIESSKNGDSFKFSKSDVGRWVDNMKKGEKVTKMVLRMLYSGNQYDKVEFDDDHMHPQVMFKDKNNYNNRNLNKMDEWIKKCQMLPNLQVLKSKYNREEKNKMPLIEWSKEHKDYFVSGNYINKKIKSNLDFNKFDVFYNERKSLLVDELCKILK